MDLNDFIVRTKTYLSDVLNKTHTVVAVTSYKNPQDKLNVTIFVQLNPLILLEQAISQGGVFNAPKVDFSNTWFLKTNTPVPLYNVVTQLVKSEGITNKNNYEYDSLYAEHIPELIGQVNVKVIHHLTTFGVGELSTPYIDIDYMMLHLLFSDSTIFFDDKFKTFIKENRYSLLPAKKDLTIYLQRRFKNLPDASWKATKNSCLSVYADTFYLFNMFLIFQRYIFLGVLTTELDEKQQSLLDTVKLALYPFSYIEDAITILSQQTSEMKSSMSSLDYVHNFKTLLITYMASCLSQPKTELLGDIKL